MHQTGHFRTALRLHGDDKPSRALCDNRLLQKALVMRGTNHLIQLLPCPGGGVPDFPPQFVQTGEAGIRDLLL